jgi:hydrogenase nickel incorporation protein HypA/HybF
MHEMSIMESTLELAVEQARLAGATRVRVLNLRVGTLSGVVPDALNFAFEAMAPGTAAEGGELRIESVPACFWCLACQAEFRAEDLLAVCPKCQSASRELRGGRELELASLEVE